MEHYLNAYQYLVQGTPYSAEAAVESSPESDEVPLSFVTCVSDEATLLANLLSSPCLGPGSPHELLVARNCQSAAEGLNQGLARARNSLVVCVHQDVYLPRGWPQRFLTQYKRAEQKFGRLGVLGVYGVAMKETGPVRIGHVVDRDRLLRERPPLPARVDTLDELLLAVPRGAGLTFDPRLGYHCYGADVCLTARQRGLAVVAGDALCLHNSRNVGVGPDFYASAFALASKWAPDLPLATSCALIDRQGQVRLW
jgi:hypothetical protein